MNRTETILFYTAIGVVLLIAGAALIRTFSNSSRMEDQEDKTADAFDAMISLKDLVTPTEETDNGNITQPKPTGEGKVNSNPVNPVESPGTGNEND